jgi:adenylate cyclase ExoY
VLAPPGDNKKPLTADYDLFMIAPSIEDFGAQDILPLHDVSHAVYKARIDNYRTFPENLAKPLKEAYKNPGKFYEPEDKEIGNTSSRIRAMIPEINQRLVGEGEPVVHHSTDTGSPATDMEANFPAAFTLPKPLGQFDEICVIRSADELKTLVQVAKNEGYYVPLNPLWEKDITSIRSSDFKNAQNVAINHWKQV